MAEEYEKKQVVLGSVKKGDTIIIEDSPCRVTNIQVSKTGKHGHAKARVEGVGIFDDKKRVIISPTHDKAEVPIVEKRGAQVLAISGNTATVMDTESYETFELPIPEELKESVKENVQVLYWKIMGQMMIKQLK